MKITLIDKFQAAEMLGVSYWTLQHWRHEGKLIEGIHYVKHNCKTLRYIKESLENKLLTLDDPQAHERYCERFLAEKQARQSVG